MGPTWDQPSQHGPSCKMLVDGASRGAAFKNHLRDFLVQTKGFASERNAELYAEETAARLAAEKAQKEQIPGMLAPNDV